MTMSTGLNAELADISDLRIFAVQSYRCLQNLWFCVRHQSGLHSHLGMQGINQIAGDVGGANSFRWQNLRPLETSDRRKKLAGITHQNVSRVLATCTFSRSK